MTWRAIHPAPTVFTAVSTRPSRPAMVWKKNSVGRKPLKKELATKPLVYRRKLDLKAQDESSLSYLSFKR